MLTLYGQPSNRFCDQVSRRGFLRIGGLGLSGMGGLALPDLLRAEASKGQGRTNKSVIMVYLPGGPPHQDMYDLKLDAPSEIRGEFRPISTKVPGMQICEHLPRLAGLADRLAVIRSIVGAKDRHESFQCMTGRLNERNPPGGWPEFGSVISKLQGTPDPTLASYVNLSPKMRHAPYNFGRPSFLGFGHTPFMPLGGIRDDMVLNGITIERLEDRKRLLASVDRFRRDLDSGGEMSGIDSFQSRAFEILTSSRLLEALDISSEDPKLRERYGKGTEQEQGDAAPRLNEQFLLARRLVEAGVRVVTLSYSFWDWHGANFRNAKQNFPDFDQALSALLEDLEQRGLLDDTTVIAWGEFGRTPQINKDGGRDHWPAVSCALLAGGGMRTGQVIGATDRFGGEAVQRPVTFKEVIATLYHNLGINAATTTVADHSGRPHYLVDDNSQPIRELV
ncbi:MAG: DUF1501 domain-containing protein [Planctomycetaceae bacterium]|nr:MAG: DUF1501 domain-containing protein [Planctomycetaceae bacterium]